MTSKQNYCTPSMYDRINCCLQSGWPWPLSVSINGVEYRKVSVKDMLIINNRNSLIQGVCPYNNKLVKVGLLCKVRMSSLGEFKAELVKRVVKKMVEQDLMAVPHNEVSVEATCTTTPNNERDWKAPCLASPRLVSNNHNNSIHDVRPYNNKPVKAGLLCKEQTSSLSGFEAELVEYVVKENVEQCFKAVTHIKTDVEPTCNITSSKGEAPMTTVVWCPAIETSETSSDGGSGKESVGTTSATTSKEKKNKRIDYKRIANRALKFGRPNPFGSESSQGSDNVEVLVCKDSDSTNKYNAYNIQLGKFVYAKPEYVSGRHKRVHIFAGYSGCGKTSSIASLVAGSCVTVVCAPGGMCKSAKEDVGPVLMQAYQRSAQLKALRNVSVREVLTYDEIMGRHFEGTLIIDDAHMIGTSELIATIMRAKDDVYVSYGVNQRGSRWRLSSMLKQLNMYDKTDVNFTWIPGGFAQYSDSEIENCNVDCVRHGTGSLRACYAEDIRAEDLPQMTVGIADGIVMCVMFSHSFRTCGINRYYKVPQHTNAFMYMGQNMYALADNWRSLCDGWGATGRKKKIEHRVWDDYETTRFTLASAVSAGLFVPRVCQSRIDRYHDYGGGRVQTENSVWIRGIDGKVELEDDVLVRLNYGYSGSGSKYERAQLEAASFRHGCDATLAQRDYDLYGI